MVQSEGVHYALYVIMDVWPGTVHRAHHFSQANLRVCSLELVGEQSTDVNSISHPNSEEES